MLAAGLQPCGQYDISIGKKAICMILGPSRNTAQRRIFPPDNVKSMLRKSAMFVVESILSRHAGPPAKVYFPMSRYLPLIGLLLSLLALPARAGPPVTVYTNVDFAPLVIDASHGLYPDLVAYLNRRLPGLHLRLAHLPRKRMQLLLDEQALDGAIIGMMPQWFGDEAQSKYYWTPPFFYDRFVLVSPASAPLRYDLGTVREGSRIGVTLGYVYPGIDAWIARAGLVRSDAPSEEKNLDKLLLGRADGVVVAESVLRHYVKTHWVAIKLQLSALPGQPIERHFLVPHGRRDLYERLVVAIKQLKDDPEWQAIRARYE